MSIATGWTDRTAERQTNKLGGLQRLTLALRQWQEEMAHRRLAARILKETRDPRVLEDLGIEGSRKDEVERFVASMLWHQH